MKKSEMRWAVAGHWKVTDDFGAIGTIIGLAADDLLTIAWEREGKPPHINTVHYMRVNRTDEEAA